MHTGKKQEKEITITSTMSTRARRRLVKPHVGFEEFVQPLITLYKANLAQMRIEGVDPDALVVKTRKFLARATDEQAAREALQRIKDERLQDSSEVWTFLLEIYARAQVFARTDPAMKRAIAEFTSFLKHGPRKTAAPVTPAVAH